MLRLDSDEKKRIQHGDIQLLEDKLKELDKALVHKLKTQRDSHDVRYWQGASHIVDMILTTLKK